MRKTFRAAMAAAVLLAASAALAQTSQPFVVASLSGYQPLMSDLGYIGQLVGRPQLAQGIEGTLALFTQGKGLEGLDKSRPWGIAVGGTLKNGQPDFPALIMLPVTDLKKLSTALVALVGAPKDVGGGVTQFQSEQGTFFVKSQDAWAVVAMSQDHLTGIPSDPLKLLAGLDKDYDIGIRILPKNVSPEMRQFFIATLRSGAEQGMARLPGEDDESFNLRKGMIDQQFAQMELIFTEFEQVVVGLSIDPASKTTSLEFKMDVTPGSASAAQLARNVNVTSDFSGFYHPEAPFTFLVSEVMGQDEVAPMLAQFDAMKASIMAQLDNDPNVSDDERKVAKELIGEFMDQFFATLEGGTLDGGMSVVGEGPFTLIGGAHVADGAKLEGTFKKLVDLGKNEPDFPNVTFNADEHKGVKFHTLSIPVPEDDPSAEPVAKALGSPIEIVVGFGKESAYIGAGYNALGSVKEAMGQSELAASKTVDPLNMSISLAPILKFAASTDSENPILGMLASSIDSGSDQIRMKTTVSGTSTIGRMEIDEGIFKLIGAMSAGPQDPAGF